MELEYWEEYETREVYILTIFKAIDVNWSIGKLTKKWKGTQKEYDILLKDYTDKGLILHRRDIHNKQPYWWDITEKDNEEIKRRNIVNKKHYKENNRRIESYRYLRGGF